MSGTVRLVGPGLCRSLRKHSGGGCGIGPLVPLPETMERMRDMDENAPQHPGEILREDILPAMGITKAALAKRLGISSRVLADLLAEKRSVTVDLALRLGAVVGYGPRYWLGLQIQYDIWRTDTARPIRLEPIVWRRPSSGRSMQALSRSAGLSGGRSAAV